jgi:hypothetical protein
MNCNDFARQLSSSGDQSHALMSHALGCARCRALLSFDQQLREYSPHPPLVMSAELRGSVALEPPPPRPFSVWRRALLPISALAASVAAAKLLAPRPDAAAVPFATAAIVSIVLIGAFLVGLLLLLARSRIGAGGLAVLRYAFPPLALGAFLTVSILAYETVPPSTYPPRSIQILLSNAVAPHLGSWVRHLPCTLVGLAVGLLLMSLTFRSASNIAITTPRASGAVCGAAGGMVAAFVLFLFCPVHLLSHLIGVHAIPLLFCSAIGLKAGVR